MNEESDNEIWINTGKKPKNIHIRNINIGNIKPWDYTEYLKKDRDKKKLNNS